MRDRVGRKQVVRIVLEPCMGSVLDIVCWFPHTQIQLSTDSMYSRGCKKLNSLFPLPSLLESPDITK